MTRPVVFFEIRGRDPAALQQFYRDLFGWTVDADNGLRYGFVEAGIGGPGEIAGGITGDIEPRTVIYVQVASLEETLAKAEALGGRRVMSPFVVPNGPTVAQAADPEGNVIGLIQQ